MSVAKVISLAWTDEEFKTRLLNEPYAALVEHGVKVPDGIGIRVLENSPETLHLILPMAPKKSDELDREEMEKIAGGAQAFTAFEDLR